MTRRWTKTLVWVVAALALFAALGFLALPPIARWQAEKLLSAELGRPVKVARVEFNPFTLRAAVEDFEIGAQIEGQPAQAGFRRLEVDAAWRSLIERAPVLQRVTLVEPRIRLVREAEGRYDIDDLIQKWRARPQEPDAPTPRFALANLVIRDGRIDFDDRVVSRLHEVSELGIRVPFVSSLPVHQEIEVEPHISAKVDGALLGVEGRSQPFVASHESTIELSVAPLDLAPYLGYLPAGLPVKPASGVFGAELRIDFEQPEAGGPMLRISGEAGLTGLSLQDPAGGPLFSAQSVRAEGFSLEPLAQTYAVQRLSIESPVATVHRRRDQPRFLEPVLAALDAQARGAGRPEPTAAPAAAPAAPSTAAPSSAADRPGAGGTAPAPDAAAVRWSVAELRVAGGRLDFLDEQFTPRPLALQASGVEASVDGLGSESGKAVAYTLALGLGTGERIEAEGSLVLQPLVVEGKASASGLALQNWWWLAEPHLQANLLGGRLALQGAYHFDAAKGPDGLKLSAVGATLESLKLAQRWDRREFLRIDSLELADTAIDPGARRVTLGSVHGAAGRVAITRDRQGGLNLARLVAAGPPTAEATHEAPNAGSQDKAWSVALGRLALKGWAASLVDAAAGRDGELHLSQLDFSAEGFDTAGKHRGKVSLRTRVGKAGTLALAGQLGLAPVGGNLRVDANRVGVLPAQPWFTDAVNLIVTSGELSAKGELGFDLPERGPVRASWRGEATLGDFAAVTKEANEDLLRWKRLHAGAVDFVLEPLKVDVGEIALSGFYSRLVISPEGRLNLQDVLASEGATATAPAASAPPAAPAAPAPATATAASAPLPVRIGRITLDDGSVYFSDHFIRPNYSASLTELGGTVGTLTPQTAGDVALRGKVAGTGSLEIAGSFNPLAPSLFLDLRASASDIDLPPTSPYSVKYLGYGIEKGKLSAKVSYTLRDRRLEAQNKVVLDQLTFGEKVDSPTATRLPVLFAISLLKDRNGVIDVEMPIGGSLDDPEFSVGGLVLRMIFNLIGKAVTAPFALLASLGGSSADLSQVPFAAGSAQLDAAANRQLEALAKALAQRPALRLDLAGRADPAADREALQRAAMLRLVKAEKAREAGRGGEGAAAIDALQLTPDEYPHYLRLAYRRASFDKPRNAIGMVRDQPPEQMERMLLAHLAIDEAALRALAEARAQAVRDWLAGHGVAGERVFLVAPKLDRKEADGARGSPTAVGLSLK